MERFILTKSYLDVVDPAGRCAISYRAGLAWGPFALQWEGLSLFEPGHSPVHRSAWVTIPRSRGAAPASPWRADPKVGGRTGGQCSLSPRLGVRSRVEPWCAPFAARLLETPAGTLDWSCDAAGADVVLETGDGIAVRGAGYAEHLELTIQPWRLPIDQLRWGRWHADELRRSIVWIEWRGERPLTLVLENGTVRHQAFVGERAIEWAGQSLHLGSTETLYSRSLADVVGAGGAVFNRLPAPWRALEDRKNLSRGVLGAAPGWAIHERVRFPSAEERYRP